MHRGQSALSEEVQLAGARELSVDIQSASLLRLLGCTVVEDSEDLFRKHREEELEERRSLYR